MKSLGNSLLLAIKDSLEVENSAEKGGLTILIQTRRGTGKII